MMNRGVGPIVTERGWVVESEDLAQVAHGALVVIGEGKALVGGVRMRWRKRTSARRPRPRRPRAEGGARARERHAGDGRR